MLDLSQVTLREYLQMISEWEDRSILEGFIVFGLVKDPAHWAEYGITTAEQLGDYLDGCARKG